MNLKPTNYYKKKECYDSKSGCVNVQFDWKDLHTFSLIWSALCWTFTHTFFDWQLYFAKQSFYQICSLVFANMETSNALSIETQKLKRKVYQVFTIF